MAQPEWVTRLSRFLMEEAGVEAILVDRESHRVSVATLGRVDESGLETKLGALLQGLDERILSQGLPTSTVVRGVRVRTLPRETLLEKPSCLTAPVFWRWREFAWPEEVAGEVAGIEWRSQAWLAGICGAALLLGWASERMAVEGGVLWLTVLCFTVSIAAGAWDAAGVAWVKLRRGELDIHFLMLAVAAGAVAIGAWMEGALLLFLFSLSGALEQFALHRTHREIGALTKAAPKTARLVDDTGGESEVAVATLAEGDRILVRPDELFAVDGEVEEGRTAADEANLTGESVAVEKSVGDLVFGGTLNLWGSVRVRVTRPAAESALQKIVHLIRHAQHLRAPSQRFTDRFGTGYTYGVLGFVGMMFMIWWLGAGLSPFRNHPGELSAFYRAMTLLVVASPCALVLSIPSAILAAIAWSARRGILFRGGAAIEKLAGVDLVALDKTGTLTTGDLRVEAVESLPPGREDEVAALAFSLESQSNHPIGRAITAYGKALGLRMLKLDEFQSIAGAGLRGHVDGGVCYLGRRELLAEGGLEKWMEDLPEPALDMTEVWVVRKDLLGRVLLRDELRAESRHVMEALRKSGKRIVMLTGDRRGAAETVAEKLGLDEVRAGLQPEDKVALIREWTKAGRRVAMVGDGVNDAPSLAAAEVSVAMGGRGSDAALEQSDVILMKDRIEKLLAAIRISESARAIIRQNLAISLGTIVVMVVATLVSGVHLTHGVLAHEGSTVLVCLNSLRLLFVREEVEKEP